MIFQPMECGQADLRRRSSMLNPCVKSTSALLPSVYRKHEREKRDVKSNVSDKLAIVHSKLLIFHARVAWTKLVPRFTKGFLR